MLVLFFDSLQIVYLFHLLSLCSIALSSLFIWIFECSSSRLVHRFFILSIVFLLLTHEAILVLLPSISRSLRSGFRICPQHNTPTKSNRLSRYSLTLMYFHLPTPWYCYWNQCYAQIVIDKFCWYSMV